MKVNIVWFKKDLRLSDHTALQLAAQERLPIILLYVYEPELWQQEDASFRQFNFLNESLAELQSECQKYHYHLNIFHGDILETLKKLQQNFTIKQIFSHQETGNLWSYKRDLKVKDWTKQEHISWHEPSQFGVVRRLKDRDGWSALWYKQMSAEILAIPQDLKTLQVTKAQLLTPEQLNLKNDAIKEAQIGGRKNALNLLNSFLYERGENYSKEMSSPVTAYDSCSRLSPYLTFGVISMKEAFQIATKRQKELKNLASSQRGKWPGALRSFLGRLRWHCHFIQKLEDQPNIETQNLHSTYDNLDRHTNQEYLEAWQTGNTGFPMIDAAMRALITTGWLNFRMRAMLVSFASNHLWLDWRVTGKYLARQFIDYEPGIHYSQLQMQSGTTGINAIRIYSPTKQVADQDPEGIFIRKYLPELEHISNKNLAIPHNEPLYIGNYPEPIVDEKIARKTAANKLYNLRKNPEHRNQASKIVQKHGSRKSGLKRTTKKL